MADTLTRRSPLQGYATRFANLPQSATVADEPFAAMVDLWVDPAGPGGAAAARVLGVDALPTTPSTMVSGGDATAIWLRPAGMAGHLGAAATEKASSRRCAMRCPNTAAPPSTFPHSARRCGCGARARGTSSPRVARWTCTPRCSGPAPQRRPMLGQAGVVLIPLSDNGTDYRIIVRSSFARYLADWLIDAAEEFGVDW